MIKYIVPYSLVKVFLKEKNIAKCRDVNEMLQNISIYNDK